MMGMVRRANPEDAPAIAAIDNFLFGADAYSEMYFYEVLRVSGLFVLIHEKEPMQITGYCVILPYHKSIKCGFVGSLGVLSEHQRKGIGSSLINDAIQRLKGNGYEELKLFVSPTNAAAISLYKSVNFTKVSTVKNAFGQGKDRILMAKTL